MIINSRMCVPAAPAAKAAEKVLTDDEDDSFERVEEMNLLEVADAASDDEKTPEDKIIALEMELTQSRRRIECLEKQLSPRRSFAIFLCFIYVCFQGHSHFFPTPVRECPKVPECPAAPPAQECPKVSTCDARPWDFENPSLLLNKYYHGSVSYTTPVIVHDQHGWFSLTGGFVSECTRKYGEGPHTGDEIIAVNGIDVREKSGEEIESMIFKNRTSFGNLLGMRSDLHDDVMLRLTVRRNFVYFERIQEAVAEAKRISFQRGALITFISCFALSIAFFSVFISEIRDIEGDAADKALAAIKKKIKNALVPTREVPSDSSKETEMKTGESDISEKKIEDKEDSTTEAAEVPDLTEVINAQKVQVEDNKVELEMFAARLIELKRECEKMEKTRNSLNSEAVAKRSWLDQMLDDCGVPQNGG